MTAGQDDHEDGDPGLARARTSLAWTRTALSFAAVGGVVLKKDIIAGLIILTAVPVIWWLGRLPTIARAASSWSPRRSSPSPSAALAVALIH